MTGTVSANATATAASLNRRAMELSHDSGVSLSEGVQHLMRLANGSSLPLEVALADLARERAPSFDRNYACLLLRVAISELGTPSLFPPHS